MNKELAQVIKAYSTLSHKELNVLLIDKSKDNIIAILIDLLTQYFNDKNSSTLRQFLIVTMSGYEMNPEKIGYNGYRQSGIGQPKEYCEAKPKNVNTSDKKLKRLNGDGNFTDYTWARFKKDKKTNPQMIVGGFLSKQNHLQTDYNINLKIIFLMVMSEVGFYAVPVSVSNIIKITEILRPQCLFLEKS